jgi:hypothetical protein
VDLRSRGAYLEDVSVQRSHPPEAPDAAAAEADEPGEAGTLERLLEHVPERTQPPRGPAQSGLRTAKVVFVDDKTVQIAFRGRPEPVVAELDDGVDRELISLAVKNGDSVLVEAEPDLSPLIVGVVQTRVPKHVALKGETVTIEAEREVVLRTGEAAVRIREDGEVEVVGSRIHTLSRGLFRIVGRVLRLN